MRIGPRYDSDPLIVLDGDPAAVVAPLLVQRRRLAATLASFDEAAWSAQSRCAAWSNREVVVHLSITNQFWTHSIAQGRLGRPTRMLTDFVAAFAPALDLVYRPGGVPRPSHRAAIVTSEPEVAFTIEVDDQVRVTDGVTPGVPVAVRGRTTDILEGLSVRTALPIDPEYRWLTDGLRRTFESPSDSQP